MSPLERLIVAIEHLEGEDALLPLNVLLPLYRHHLGEPARRLIELYDSDRAHGLAVIEALFNADNMYWFDVTMHYNDQDLLNSILLDGIDNVIAFRDPIVKKLDEMAKVVRKRTRSDWPFFFIRVMYVASTDKALALHLPRLEPYLTEVAAMVEQGYPTSLQLP